MLYAGLDLSRKRLDFHLLDAEGASVDVGAAPPDADGLRGLDDVRVDAPDRAVEHDRAIRSRFGIDPADVVGPPHGRLVVILENHPPHPKIDRLLCQVGVVDGPVEQRRMGVGVHIDGVTQQLKIGAAHRSSLHSRTARC